MPPTALILYFLLALTVSFVCSLLEAIILSVTPGHIEVLVERGRASGRILKALKARIDRPLIAILTLNTVANMFGSAGVGAEASRWAHARGWTESENLVVLAAAAALTACILIGSEIIPKTLGATHWRTLAGPAAYPLRILVVLLTPVVVSLESIPKLISKSATPTSVTRDELAVLAKIGRQGGSITLRDAAVITNLPQLATLRAKDVMTPRVEIFALHKDRTAREIVETESPLRYSRIPLFDKNIDDITGLALRYTILERCISNLGTQTLSTLATNIHFVPETASLAHLLEEFIRRRDHLFIVVNEYAGTEGIITLEDIIETLLGVEIVDELDETADLQRRARLRHSDRSTSPASRPTPPPSST